MSIIKKKLVEFMNGQLTRISCCYLGRLFIELPAVLCMYLYIYIYTRI